MNFQDLKGKAESFIFGPGTEAPSYEALKRRREIADLLMKRTMATQPKNIGEGLSMLGQAILAKRMDSQLGPQEDAARKRVTDQLTGIMGGGFTGQGMGGYSGNPATLSSSGGTPVTPALGGSSTIDMIKANVFPGEAGSANPSYDTLFSHAQQPGGAFAGTRVSDMTINQALDFADPSGPYGKYVAGQNDGTVSTPMGPFQIIGSTLRGARDQMGLTGNEKFDQAMQDRIAEHIYKTQGPGAWEAWGKGGPAGDFIRAAATGLPGGSGQDMSKISQIVQLMDNPYLSEGQRMLAQAIIQQQLSAQMSPYQAGQLGLDMLGIQQRQAEAEMEAAQAETPDPANFGLNLQYWTDENGTLHAGQLTDQGGVVEVPLPDGGGAWAPGVGNVDMGGMGTGQVNRRTGAIENIIPKDIAGAEAQKVLGEGYGKAATSLGERGVRVKNAIDTIDRITSNPALKDVTGMVQGLKPTGFNQAQTDVIQDVKKLGGQIFSDAIDALVGMGAMSNMEGQTAKEGMANLSRLYGDEAFPQELGRLKALLLDKLEIARQKAESVPGAIIPDDLPQAGEMPAWMRSDPTKWTDEQLDEAKRWLESR